MMHYAVAKSRSGYFTFLWLVHKKIVARFRPPFTFDQLFLQFHEVLFQVLSKTQNFTRFPLPFGRKAKRGEKFLETVYPRIETIVCLWQMDTSTERRAALNS
jgi:hypothetical protein